MFLNINRLRGSLALASEVSIVPKNSQCARGRPPALEDVRCLPRGTFCGHAGGDGLHNFRYYDLRHALIEEQTEVMTGLRKIRSEHVSARGLLLVGNRGINSPYFGCNPVLKE